MTNKSYSSFEELQAEWKKWEKDHPFQHWFKQNIYYPIYRIPGKIEDFFLEIKHFVQRGKRGYADCDIWSFDTYLARLIVEGTKEIKRVKHGIPMILFKPSDKGYKDGNFSDETMKEADARYDSILEEIIWTFEIYRESHLEGQLLIPTGIKYYTEKELKKLRIFCKRMNEKSYQYRIISEKDFERYLNGWELFKNYFSSLND